MIEGLGAPQLTLQIADDITRIFLNVSRGISEALQIAEIEMSERREATHLHGEGDNVGVVTDVEGLQCLEGADAEGNLPELVVGEIELLNGGGGDIGGQVLQLVVSKVDGSERGRPFRHVGDHREPVV